MMNDELQLTDPVAQRMHVLARAGTPTLCLLLLAWTFWLKAESDRQLMQALEQQSTLLSKQVQLIEAGVEIDRQTLETRRQLLERVRSVNVEPDP